MISGSTRNFAVLCFDRVEKIQYYYDRIRKNIIVLSEELLDVIEVASVEKFKSWANNKMMGNPNFGGSFTANGFRVLHGKELEEFQNR